VGSDKTQKICFASLISHGQDFLNGAAVLGLSLKKYEPSIDRILLVEEGQYGAGHIRMAESAGWQCRIVHPIRSQPTEFAAERWPYTFTKLHVWNITDYDKVWYMDADCCAHETGFSWIFNKDFSTVLACSVTGEAGMKRFNAGVMVLKPHAEVFAGMHHRITTEPAKSTGAKLADQGFLNIYFDHYTQMSNKYNNRHWDKPVPGVAISHQRPHPWAKKERPKALIPYWKEWCNFRSEVSRIQI